MTSTNPIERGDPGDRVRRVALLRGINVGGKNKLPMKDLVVIFEDAGCRGVRTYIQSGNVVFEAAADLASTLPDRVASAIRDRFGYDIPVVMRSADELGAVVADNPFLQGDADIAKLHVAFLASAPDASQVAALDPAHSPPDEFVVRGREIYLHCPAGMARTRLTNAYFDSRLDTTSTMRNWSTVGKLVAMIGEP